MERSRRDRFYVDDAITRLKRGETTVPWYELREPIHSLEESTVEEDRYWLVSALYHSGVALDRAQQPDAALATFRDCVERFGEVQDAETAALVTTCAASAGITAVRDRRNEESLQYLDLAIQRLGSATRVDDRRLLASALTNRAAVVRHSRPLDQAGAAYDAVYKQFHADDDPEICRKVALALHEKGKMLETAGENDHGVAAFRFFVSECGQSWDPTIFGRILESIAKLPKSEQASASTGGKKMSPSRLGLFLLEKGTNHLLKHEIDPALEYLGKAIHAFEPEPTGYARVGLARAIHNCGMALQEVQRHDEAIAAFESVIARFGNEADTDMRKLVISARTNAAVSAGGARRFDDGIAHLDAVARDVDGSSRRDDRGLWPTRCTTGRPC
jgi:tetratricopeptide (TPR) repeat protein